MDRRKTVLKNLIFICGANGIGKSTTCAALYLKLNQSALVDSDYCRMIHPFEFSDEQKRIVEDNMTTMLINYLKCSTINNIIFSYGLHGPRKQIFDNIMIKLSNIGISYKFIPIILECDLEENIRRAQNDGRDECRIQFGIKNSRDIYKQFDYSRLNITNLTTDEVVNELMNFINGKHPAGNFVFVLTEF